MKIDFGSCGLSGGNCQLADLTEESSSVFRVHPDELDRYAVVFFMAPHKAAPAHLSSRHVQEDLHKAANRHFFPGSQKDPADREVLHIRNFPLHSRPPSSQHTRRGLDPGVGPLFNVHRPRPYSGGKSTYGLGPRSEKLQSNSRFGGACWGPTRPAAMSA